MLRARSTLALLALAALAPAASAGTLHVDAGLATGLNDGSSWANAFQGSGGLQTALAAAVSGDLVFAKQGTYLPTGSGARTASFVLKTGVEVYGGFVGGETSPAQRPPLGTAPSVLSGDLAGNDGGGSFADNSFHVLRGGGADATAVLDGFTVSGGNADGAGVNDKGGAFFCNGVVSPTIRSCRFTAHRAMHGGVGYVNGASAAPTFSDCTFEDSLGNAAGGAVALSLAGAVRFERCVFRGNQAGRGGALDVSSSDGVVVSNCLFDDNLATGGSGGGALWIGGLGTTLVQSCTIVANASSVQAVAGLSAQGGASVSAANCILWDNAGPGGAQAAANQIAGVAATHSIVEGGLAGAGNLSADPEFADAGSGDYSLGSSSPAVDAGDNASVPAGVTLDLARAPRFVDDLFVTDTGAGVAPLVDIGAYEQPQGSSSFCDASDGSLDACPCANPGAPDTGCDTSQSTGGVRLDVLAQTTSPNGATLRGSGFSTGGSPVALVIRSAMLDPARPVVFGDGVRCISLNGLVRLAATLASAGTSTHVIVHGAGAGPGAFYYQLWFRSLPTSFCDPASAYSTSNGRALSW